MAFLGRTRMTPLSILVLAALLPLVFGGKEQKEYYYHQIFFHYVLQDGQRAQYAWDRSK